MTSPFPRFRPVLRTHPLALLPHPFCGACSSTLPLVLLLAAPGRLVVEVWQGVERGIVMATGNQQALIVLLVLPSASLLRTFQPAAKNAFQTLSEPRPASSTWAF
jgi:hypothetical protein